MLARLLAHPFGLQNDRKRLGWTRSKGPIQSRPGTVVANRSTRTARNMVNSLALPSGVQPINSIAQMH